MKLKTTLAIFLFVSILNLANAQDKLKIYISVDMEGLAGVVSAEQLGPSGFEYGLAREIMTREVNAAIEGAVKAGATEFVISDSHGNGQNLLIEKLPKDVLIVRSWPRHLSMMAGIDETFDGVIFLGYHVSTNSKEGVRAHTFSSTKLTDVKINMASVSEAAYNAIIAGHYNVPVIMVSGDDKTIEETRRFLGDIEGAVVKWAYSYESAKTLTPEAALDIIKSTSEKAVKKIKEFKPYKVKYPVQLDVSFKNYRPSEILDYLSIVERTDSHSIRFVGKNIIEVADFFTFIMTYSSDINP